MIISHRNKPWQSRQEIGTIALAILPAISFLAQYYFSVRAGTRQFLFQHWNVMVVDWVFVPFNYFVVRTIEWRRGGRLYLIMCASVALNSLTYVLWQHDGSDPGHMITTTGVVLPAGWVHLVFSIMETNLLMAFVFCRRNDQTKNRMPTLLATIYFLAMGICGYAMHNRIISSDASVFVSGLFFILIYPKLTYRSRFRF